MVEVDIGDKQSFGETVHCNQYLILRCDGGRMHNCEVGIRLICKLSLEHTDKTF